MRQYIENRKYTRKGVYWSLAEATATKASRNLVIEPNDSASTYEWKCSSGENHHEHSPLFTIHSLNIPLLASTEAELREKGAIYDDDSANMMDNFDKSCDLKKLLNFTDDLKKIQRQMLVQTIANDTKAIFPSMNDIDDYDSTKKHHSLLVCPHVLVNIERAKRNIIPLCRENDLDELASEHAKQIAAGRGKKHSNVNDLISRILDYTASPLRRLGENVVGGNSIEEIFQKIFWDPNYNAERNNMFDRRFSSFGIGVAVSSKGKTYICQIFKG